MGLMGDEGALKTHPSCLLQRVRVRVTFTDHIVIAGDLTDVDILLASLRTRTLAAMDMMKTVRLGLLTSPRFCM